MKTLAPDSWIWFSRRHISHTQPFAVIDGELDQGGLMVLNSLLSYLNENGAKYVTIRHSPAFTAPEVAASAHVSGRWFAKTVIVKLDDIPSMLILPATRRLDLLELSEMLGSDDVKLATERELREWFPDCEIGAMPPFGNLYGLTAYIDSDLAAQTEIAFNGGTHTDIIRMPYAEFSRLARPIVLELVTF